MDRLETRDEFHERRAHEFGYPNYSTAHDEIRQRIDAEYDHFGAWSIPRRKVRER